MAKYRFTTSETHYLTYIIDVPDGVDDTETFFYNLTDETLEASIVADDCYDWQLDSINKLKPEDSDNV
jgi:hypothetical protein